MFSTQHRPYVVPDLAGATPLDFASFCRLVNFAAGVTVNGLPATHVSSGPKCVSIHTNVGEEHFEYYWLETLVEEIVIKANVIYLLEKGKSNHCAIALLVPMRL